MATVDDGDRRPQPPEMHRPQPSKTFRLKLHPGTATPLVPRRRKIAVARLGSRRGGRRVVAGILRRVRFRWLAEQYRKALKKLQQYRAALMRDLIESAAALEVAQSRLVMQTSYLAAPFLPVTSANYGGYYCGR